jgi:UDP-GlcNAc:undecaprenyl-phosphate GlcNAc-1-phosphate transferase
VYSILFLTATSFLCCLALTPLVTACSQRLGLVDCPNTNRKLHERPTARTGGVAIALSYLTAFGLLLLSPLKGADSVSVRLAVALMPAALIIFVTGLLDDLIGLRAWQKLTAQFGAAGLAYAAGVTVGGVAGFALQGWWTFAITAVWLVACSNAFNLIDGTDGLAVGVGLFASLTTLAAALMQHSTPLALATAPLVGALVAFLRYNFAPASIFLGDCGSLTIGFLLGCFAAMWSQKSATLLGMTAPLMALSVPLLDTGMSVLRRFLRRQPILSADRNHLHHRLLDRGFTPRQVALLLYGVCGVAAAFALLMTWPHNRFDGLLLAVFCVAAWMGVRLVGYVEVDTARHLVLTGTFRHLVNDRLLVDGFEKKAAAAVSADDYWSIIREVASELGVPHVRMSLDGRIFEHTAAADLDLCCATRIPLSESGYVNFRYSAGASVRHAVAITSIVAILQRSIAERPTTMALAATLMPDQPASSVRVVRSLALEPIRAPHQRRSLSGLRMRGD